MSVLKWGIAAAGRITHDFVTALSTLEPARHSVVAVADVEVARAAQFAEKHQILRFYDGFDALASDKEVQIVYVGTLTPYHYAVVRLMLERGKHVLCETPMCLCLQQAAELYNLAKQKALFLMEGMWSRFFPSYQRLRELLLADSIGDVQCIQVRHGYNAMNIERITSRALGGSILLELGLYAIQLGQFIYKCAPISITANAILNDDGIDVDGHFKLNYGEQRTLIAVITAKENLENCAKIIGTKGEIKLSNHWCCTLLTKPNNTTETWPLPTAKFDFHHANACGLRFEAEEVRKCLEKYLIECPSYTHAESLEVCEILDEIRRQIGVRYDDVIGQ